MAQVVIAGCGYVGNALARMLMDEGHEVFGIRRDVSALAAGVKGIRGNVARPDELGPAPARVEYAVFAVGADEGQRPRRLVMTSSTSVYGQRRGEPIDEKSPTHPTQFRGSTLLASEGLAAASGIPSVVVRLGGIYGPGRTSLIDRAREGRLRLRPNEHFTNRIHRDDAAGLIRHLLFHPNPEPLYLGVDDRSSDEAEVYRWLAKELAAPPPEPEEEGDEAGRRRAVGSKRCSNQRARESGYRFRYPTYREGYGELIRSSQGD